MNFLAMFPLENKYRKEKLYHKPTFLLAFAVEI